MRDFHNEPGGGVSGHVEGHRVVVGNERFVQAHVDEDAAVSKRVHDAVEQMAEKARTPVVAAVDGVVIAVVAVADALRDLGPGNRSIADAGHRRRDAHRRP